MHVPYWLVGLLTGFVGPFVAMSTGIIAANFTLEHGFKTGILFGLGNSLVQLLWGGVSAFAMFGGGFSRTMDKTFLFIGAAVILFFAVKMFKSPVITPTQTKDISQKTYIKSFFTGMVLTLTAPQRCLLYLAIFAGFGVHYAKHNIFTQIPLIVSVCIGAFIWWILFITIVSRFKQSMTEKRFFWLKRIGAIMLFLMGIWSLIGGVFK